MKLPDSRGSILIAVTFVMLLLALMAITGVSMLVNQSQTSLNVMRMAQAHAIRQGVSEFLQRRIQYDADWSDLADETIILDGQSTAVIYTNRTRGAVDVETRTDATLGSTMITNKQSFRLSRIPTAIGAARFAIFKAEDTGAWTLKNSDIQHGDVYSNGSLVLSGSSVADGEIYSSVNEAGRRFVPDPQPRMPAFDTGSGYARYIPSYDADIAAAILAKPDEDASDCVFTADTSLGGGTTQCRDAILAGSQVTITGPGKIVAWRNVFLQNDDANSCEPTTGTDMYSSDGGCKKSANPDAGLVWGAERAADTWAVANDACNNLDTTSGPVPGYSDWRLPSEQQMVNVSAQGGGYFRFDSNRHFWASDPAGRGVNLSNGNAGDYPLPTDELPFVCVRDAAASKDADTDLVSGDGKLIILAGGSIYKTDDTRSLGVSQSLPVNAEDPGVVILYAKGPGELRLTASTYNQAGTNIDTATFLARDRMRLGPRVKAHHAYFFMPSGSLEITGDGTVAGQPVIDGIVATVSDEQPAMRLTNTVLLNGLVYSGGGSGATTGTLEINGLKGSMTILTNRLENDLAENLTILGPLDPETSGGPGGDDILSSFAGSVSVTHGSWRGN